MCDISGVYFMFRDDNDNSCKIGWSDVMFTRRLREGQSFCNVKLRIHVYYPTTDTSVEKALHTKFAHLNEMGEWFTINRRKAVSIVSELIKHNGNVDDIDKTDHLTCVVCTEKFSSKKKYNDHVHRSEVPCVITVATMDTETVEVIVELNEDKITDMRNNLQCHRCDRQFKIARNYQKHMTLTPNCITPLICPHCDNDFGKRRNAYIQHLQRKTPCVDIDPSSKNEKNRQLCCFCKKTYSSVSNLNKHYTRCKKFPNDIKKANKLIKISKQTRRIMQLEEILNRK